MLLCKYLDFLENMDSAYQKTNEYKLKSGTSRVRFFGFSSHGNSCYANI